MPSAIFSNHDLPYCIGFSQTTDHHEKPTAPGTVRVINAELKVQLGLRIFCHTTVKVLSYVCCSYCYCCCFICSCVFTLADLLPSSWGVGFEMFKVRCEGYTGFRVVKPGASL